MIDNAHLFASINRMYRLIDLRRRYRLTQNEVAARMGVRQPRVSQLEAGDLSRMGIGSLNAYVDALGGQLRVVADFGDEVLHLHLDLHLESEPRSEARSQARSGPESSRLRVIPESRDGHAPADPAQPIRTTATA